MDAMTLYISILTVSYLIGVFFCVYINAPHKVLLTHFLQAAASVWVASIMPEWMIWASCALMIISIVAAAYAAYKYDLINVYKTVMK